MVYLAVFGFTFLSAGAAILVLLFGWRADEKRLQTHIMTEAALLGEGTALQAPSIEQIQEHIDAEQVGIEEFAMQPSERSLYAVGEGAAHAA